jgi:predicted ATPase/DNA-binding winged helix-turn-helix (wHTH) protein
MQEELPLYFGPFRVEPKSARLWRGQQELTLTPKAFAVLRYLMERPGQLATKEDLFRAVWPETCVSDAALTVCIREIRKALTDDPKAPQFIETMHRRGYRFIAKVASSQHAAVSSPQQPGVPGLASNGQKPTSEVKSFHSALRTPHSTFGVVGRETELRQLHRWLEKAQAGERQVVFVTGEPGIGKTTLVRMFLEQVAAAEDLWLGQGQCIERFGTGEAYLPVLAALGQLCRQPEGQRLLAILSQYAPTWLVQLPALFGATEYEVLQQRTAGVTQERMLREMAEALEALTAERPLVLVLEDLHWSDTSTLDLLSLLARRRQAARLLVIGTYRPVDVILRNHPLKSVKQELQLHRQCEELRLRYLSVGEVEEYLAGRLPESPPPAGLATVIHRRTEGNPLFLVNVIDYVIAQGVVEQRGGQWELAGELATVEERVPDTLRHMIERQIDRLSTEDQQVLEVASVARTEFSAAAVAAGLEVEVREAEGRCAELARQGHFLRATGLVEWPDGTVAAGYAFIHSLYQSVLYDYITAARRLELHTRIGARKEAAYGNRAGEIATELALHFERGRDSQRAVHYLQQAAENALRRSAHQEALSHLTRGLALLKTLPDTPERARQELDLLMSLGPALMATEGYGAPEVERAYTRARELCQQVEETPQLFPVLWGLWVFYFARGELQTGRELGEHLLDLAQRAQDPALLLEAHVALGATLFRLGEVASARAHSEQGIALYDPQQHCPHAFLYGQDPRVACLSDAAGALGLLGYPDQALKRIRDALTCAQALSHPFSLAFARYFAAQLHQQRQEVQLTREGAEATMALCGEQGCAHFLAIGTILRGWALAEQGQAEEGIAQIRQGLAALRDKGAETQLSYFLTLLAEAYGKGGQPEEGLSILAEALAVARKTGECFYEAELYRLKGELLLNAECRMRIVESSSHSPPLNTQHSTLNTQAEAEACSHKAIEIARQQQAKSLELRAVVSLSRLWQRQGRQAETRQLLAEIYGWFTEGFDTADLQEAKALLAELERNRKKRPVKSTKVQPSTEVHRLAK